MAPVQKDQTCEQRGNKQKSSLSYIYTVFHCSSKPVWIPRSHFLCRKTRDEDPPTTSSPTWRFGWRWEGHRTCWGRLGSNVHLGSKQAYSIYGRGCSIWCQRLNKRPRTDELRTIRTLFSSLWDECEGACCGCIGLGRIGKVHRMTRQSCGLSQWGICRQ